MQVTLKLKDWRVIQDDSTKTPAVAGSYQILLPNNVVAANQAFNGSYNEMKFPFSQELIKEITGLEDKIKAEIEGILKSKAA